jgi:hypothetical protein
MVIGLAFLMWSVETPRYLVSKKKFVEARKAYAWIGKVNGLDSVTIEERLNEIWFEGEQPEKLRDNSVVSYIAPDITQVRASNSRSGPGSF